MPAEPGETLWAASLRYGRLELERVEVKKRTPKRIVLTKHCAALGFRTHISPVEPGLFESRAGAAAYLVARSGRAVEDAERRLTMARQTLEEARRLALAPQEDPS